MGDEAGSPSNQIHGNVIGSVVQAGKIDQVVLPPPEPLVLGTIASMRGDVPDFTGRRADLDRLFALVAAATGESSTRAVAVYAVNGMAGVGKTSFCVHAAHQLADRFPDGQLFLELHGHTPGQEPVSAGQALGSLLLAVGVDPKLIPLSVDDRAWLWRGRIADRKMLVVLDDVATEAQVQLLLPGTAGSLMLITSRRHLGGLDGVRPLPLQVLPESEAVSMLSRISGRAPDQAGDDAVLDIVHRCGGLPLAIALAAARLRTHPTWDFPYLAGLLADAGNDLDHLHAGDRSVRAAFQTSYQHLPPERQRLFRLLGVFPRPEFDTHAVAALAEAGVARVREDLEALYEDNLIQETAPDRYRLHDLLRAYVHSLAADLDQDEHDRAAHRVVNYYLRAATVASTLLPTYRAPNLPKAETEPVPLPRLATAADTRTWLAAELPTLIACQEQAAAGQDKPWAVHFAAALQPFFLRFNGDPREALHVMRTALAAAIDTGDRLGQASTLLDLGRVHQLRGEYTPSFDALTRAYHLYTDLDNRLGKANALLNLGRQRFVLDEYAPAEEHYARAHAHYAALGNEIGQADTLTALSAVHQQRGEYQRSIDALTQAHDRYVGAGDRMGRAKTVESLGVARYQLGDYPLAVRTLIEAHQLSVDLDDRWAQANALANLGIAQRLWGKVEAAVRTLRIAYDMYTKLGFQMGRANTLTNLGCLYRQQGATAPAAEALTCAYDLFVQVGDRDGEAETLNNLGDLGLDHPDTGDPRAHFGNALAIAREIGTALHEAHALHGLARCLLREHDTEGARELLRKAHTIYDTLQSPEADRVGGAIAALNRPEC
ncbi:MAG TPA: tetratricopeptide repeat protein [Pseudonocardiaceae bacterium]|jgi:tetratricopeptide (TPR) repeat protein|nr:tetratricopeptide repeat protein [Pseudonocardiaceae bacterium]